MKLAIFGATGKTGQLLLNQALLNGHEIKALARSPGKLQPQDRLSIVKGSVDEASAVAETIAGVDAVISTLGAGNGTLVQFGRNAIDAMQQAGVSRIVSLIGASVQMPGDKASMNLTLLKAITHSFGGPMVKDGIIHAKDLAASPLEYTLVRPPRLTDGPATGRIRHANTLNLGPLSSISRADLAPFILKVAEENLYRRAAPMVCSAQLREPRTK